MFSFFTRKPRTKIFQHLEVDMHSHLIPGVDDGSPDLPTSLALIRGLQALGYRKLITTPHVMTDLYPNTSRGLNDAYAPLREALREEGIPVQLEVAAEYFLDRTFETLVDTDDLLCFGARRYVLIEMSFVAASPHLEEVVFALITRGYQPILAHPERYTYLIGRKGVFHRLQSLGCLLQLNILSLTGHYGKSIQQWAHTLLKNEMIAFLGTDLHHGQHLDSLIHYRYDRKLHDLVTRYPFQNKELH